MAETPPSHEHPPGASDTAHSADAAVAPPVIVNNDDAHEEAGATRARLYTATAPTTPAHAPVHASAHAPASAGGAHHAHGHHDGPWMKGAKITYGIFGYLFSLAWNALASAHKMTGGASGGHGGGGSHAPAKKKDDGHGHH